MKTKSLLTPLFVLSLALASCAPKAAAPTKAATSAAKPAQATAVKAQPTTASKPTVKPAEPTPMAATATPVMLSINTLNINDQKVSSGEVLVSLVTAIKPGWVAVFTDNNGQPGTLLGYTAVPVGTTDDIKVTVDSKKVTSKMIAVLLVDEGAMGTFEYPGADMIATESGHNVMIEFSRLSS